MKAEKPIAVEDLLSEIAAKRRAKYEGKAQAYPRNNPIASDISDCVRETVLGITNWRDRPAFSVDVLERLERGNMVEDWILRELQELGYRIRVDRKPFEMRDKQGRLLTRGRIDGFISCDHREYPFEVKSMTPLMYAKIDSQEDFDRYIFFRKYPRQLQSYLLAENLEEGFWILDDCMGHWKLIPCRLDFERAENILRHLETAVEHLVAGTLPDFHTDPQVCLKCWAFKRVCTPPFSHGEGMQVFGDPELEEKIKRRADLDLAATEYGQLDREIKTLLKAVMKPEQIFLVGDYLIKAEEKIRQLKAQPAREAHEQKFLTFEIAKIEAEK